MSSLVEVDEFVNPHQALPFPSISGSAAGVNSAGSGVTPLVLAAQSQVLPQLINCCIFLPFHPSILGTEQDVSGACSRLVPCLLHPLEPLLLDGAAQCNLEQLPAKGLFCYLPPVCVSPLVLKISVLKACNYTNMCIQSWELIWGGLNNAHKSTAF